MKQVYKAYDARELKKAGPTDLLELLPPAGGNPLYIPKHILETLVAAITAPEPEFVHLSGPTGSAKSSLIEALHLRPENFAAVCRSLGRPEKPLTVFAVEMAVFETPGELFQRRALRDGSTYDERSCLVDAFTEAARIKGRAYPLIWLREIGRVPSSMVQGGLLNLMCKGDIVLPDGERLDGRGVAILADSNYQAEQTDTHTLVTLDSALNRRFTVQLTLDYLSSEQEVEVLRHLMLNGNGRKIGKEMEKLIVNVVALGASVRRQRTEGNLQSVPPPTIYGYLAFLRLAGALGHLTQQQVALSTILGNAGMEDRKHVTAVFNEVFGMAAYDESDPVMGSHVI